MKLLSLQISLLSLRSENDTMRPGYKITILKADGAKWFKGYFLLLNVNWADESGQCRVVFWHLTF